MSLHYIDMLIDTTAEHSIFSLIDGFSSYNQIKMHTIDMEKTSLRTLMCNSLHCHDVHAGATSYDYYFHDILHNFLKRLC